MEAFGLFLRPRVTPFVILFIERDGSTYLTSLLMSHAKVKAIYERFSVMKQKGQSGQEQNTWARKFLTPKLIGRWGAIGFKTKLVDILDPAGFAGLLQSLGGHVIQMGRRNHVKAAISKINARRLYERTGNWNLYKETDRLPPLSVQVQEFDKHLSERAQAELQLTEYVQELNLPTLRLDYEDLLSDRDAALASVFSFLGVSNQKVKGRTLKHTSDDLREVLLNFDELRSHYTRTAYGPMFEERTLEVDPA